VPTRRRRPASPRATRPLMGRASAPRVIGVEPQKPSGEMLATRAPANSSMPRTAPDYGTQAAIERERRAGERR